MFGLLAFDNVDVVLFCEPVVPAAIPGSEPVGIALSALRDVAKT